MSLDYELRTRSDRSRLVLSGEMDVFTNEELTTLLRHLLDGLHAVIEVDLHGVTFLDCASIGVLVGAQNAARRRGRAVIVSCPQGIAHLLLEITGVLPYLTGHRGPTDGRQDAVDVVGAGFRPRPRVPRTSPPDEWSVAGPPVVAAAQMLDNGAPGDEEPGSAVGV